MQDQVIESTQVKMLQTLKQWNFAGTFSRLAPLRVAALLLQRAVQGAYPVPD